MAVSKQLKKLHNRIQNRLLDITDDAPPNLFFATMSERLHSGLEQQIERFLTSHPDTALIVIDTLQRIRGGDNDANPYASDYRDLGILKELADKHRIAILLIYHLRKMNDDDSMNMISGTTEISGATDTNFILRKNKRSSSSAALYCTGQDIECRELLLEYIEVNVRTICNLIRFKCMKSAGMVQSMDEFLELFYSKEE